MLLRLLLLNGNAVLNAAARSYALRLMAEVIPAQRWETPDEHIPLRVSERE